MHSASQPRQVTVHGSGVAAYCSALLLDRAGIRVTLSEAKRPGVPAIMIGDATQRLIVDIFERRGLFGGLHAIFQRVVAWGSPEPKTLPHSAVVISEEQLSARLRPEITADSAGTAGAWTIHAAKPLPADVNDRPFGTRTAAAFAVRLRREADAGACWIESLERGWLFLIPNSPNEGWLLSVGHEPDSLVASSGLIASRIESVETPRKGGAFPSHPRIADPLCGSGWLCCGTAAMAFDPICGDGTGNAVREAILAAAVVRAGGEPEMLDHYRRRLILGFERHLQQCRQFYATGGDSDWWRGELAQVVEGIGWCRRALVEGNQQFRYQLRNFDLEEIT